MMSRLIAAILLSTLLVAPIGGAAHAQQALRGKSVVVSWTEERMQRRPGESEFRPATRRGGFSAYIGSTGRIFNRVSMTNPKRGRSGSADRVGDGPRRQVTISGRTMTAIQQAAAGGRRRAAHRSHLRRELRKLHGAGDPRQGGGRRQDRRTQRDHARRGH
jgi:hypothetical protein